MRVGVVALLVLAGIAVGSQALPLRSSARTSFVYGVDVSVDQGIETYKCFRTPGYKGKSRVVPLASRHNDGPNYTPAKQAQIAQTAFTRLIVRTPLLNGRSPAATIKAAAAAGYQKDDIGVYFIDFRAKRGPASAAALINSVADSLAPVAHQFGTLWLDVEGKRGGTYWAQDQKTNCAYMTEVVKTIKANPAKFPWKLGMYTGMYGWPDIVGPRCSFDAFKDMPLWYAGYGPSFDTFSSFRAMPNAWQHATVHQWHGTTRFCGTVVDFNIYQ